MENIEAVGITAEYNPFHRGHEYHIRKTRSRADASPIIAVISSDFVQRGEPALADKSLRAAMALAHGVDLVLELPVVFSSSNAGVFANAAVDILAATGLVKTLSFGMEAPDTALLERAAETLAAEPPEFKLRLRELLSEGYSYVQARSSALDQFHPDTANLLSSPNNNLALAYIVRIKQKSYNMRVDPVKREGAGFHDSVTSDENYASAGGIRELLYAGKRTQALALVPERASALMSEAQEAGHLHKGPEAFWRAVKQAVVRAGREGLAGVSEMREGLENRIWDQALRADNLDSFIEACTSRRYTKGRIMRYLTHLLIGLDHESGREFQRWGPAYIRVLGANERGRALIAEMRTSASLPVLSRPSAPGDAYASRMMDFEHKAAELWELMTENPRLRREAQYKPVLV